MPRFFADFNNTLEIVTKLEFPEHLIFFPLHKIASFHIILFFKCINLNYTDYLYIEYFLNFSHV